MKELYNKLAQFSNKPDFSHMMITGVVELKNSSSFLASFGARGKPIPASGWLGDVSTIGPGMDPSFDNADYKADLDAVNIARRIKDEHKTLDDTLTQYNNAVDSGVTYRAQEFQRHYKIKDIINEINNVDTSGLYVLLVQ